MSKSPMMRALSMLLSICMVFGMIYLPANASTYDVANMTNAEVLNLCVELSSKGDEDALAAIAADLGAIRAAEVEALYAALNTDEPAAVADSTAKVTAYKQVSYATAKVVDAKYFEEIGTVTDLEGAVTLIRNSGANGGLIEISAGTLYVTNRQDITMANLIIKGAGKTATTIAGDTAKFNNSTNGLANKNGLSSEFKTLLGLPAENLKVMDLTIDGTGCGHDFGLFGGGRADFKTVRINSGVSYLENVAIKGNKGRTNLMIGTSSTKSTVYATNISVAKAYTIYGDTEIASGSKLTAVNSVLGGTVVGSTENLGAGYYKLSYNGLVAYTTIPYAIECYKEGTFADMLASVCTNEGIAAGTSVAAAMTADLTTVLTGKTTLLYGYDCAEMKALAAEFKTALAGLSADTKVDVSVCLEKLTEALAIANWHTADFAGVCTNCGAEGLKAPTVQVPAVDELVSDSHTEAEKEAIENVATEIKQNTALDNFVPTNLPENTTLSVLLTSMGVENGTAYKLTFEVAPKDFMGTTIQPSGMVTFRLPIPASVIKTHANVYHNGELMGTYEIEGDGNGKYVEVETASFSEFTVETVDAPATSPEVDTQEELLAALANGGTVKLGADIATTGSEEGDPFLYILTGENAVLDLNGYKITPAAYDEYMTYFILICGDLTITDTSDAGNGSIVAAEGGYLSAESTYLDGIGWTDAPVITVNGGTVTNLAVGDAASVIVNGGDVKLYLYQPDYFYEQEEYDAYLGSVTIVGEAEVNLPEGYTLGEDGKIAATKTFVAQIGDQKFETLQDAINAAGEGDTIVLLANIELNKLLTIPAEKSLTIDGDGYKLTPAAGFDGNVGGHRAALVLADGDRGYSAKSSYTIKNLTFEGFSGLSRILRANFCDAVIENCSFVNNAVNGGIITSADALLTVTGCTFEGNTISGDAGYGVIDLGSDVSAGSALKATISNNKFIDNKVEYAVLFLFTSADVTGNYFTGNEHTGSNPNAAAILAGPYTGNMAYEIDINENAFVNALNKGGAALPAVFAEDWSSLGVTTAFDLDKNYWDGGKPSYGTSGNPDVTIKEYYTTYENGTLGGKIEIVNAVAQIGDQKFETLEEALKAVQAGQTVELLGNVAISNNEAYGIFLKQAITIDGKGYTITVADGYSNEYALMYLYAVTGTVTIKNLTFDGIKSGAAIWAHNADLVIENCVFQNGEHAQVQGLVRTTCSDLTVRNSKFLNNNCNFVITFNFDAADSNTMLVESCEFRGNTVKDTAVIYYVDGASSTITGSTFEDNTITSASHGAVVYYSNGANGSVTNNVFRNNTIKAAGVRASVLALEAGTTATGNAFIGNSCTSTASGTTYVATVLNKAEANTAGVVISGNYWDGGKPDVVNAKGAPAVLDNYYTTYENGTLGGLTENAVNVAQVGDQMFTSLQAAIEAVQAGQTIKLLADITLTEIVTLPAGITLNGNGYFINGEVHAAGNLTFEGYTKINVFNPGYNKPVITIGVGACLEMVTGRMVVGHGATFNIEGNIADAKTANVADLTPSLIVGGASFTGAGVNFNVTNAYVKFTYMCTTKSSSANGTFNFNITNSIWEQTNKLAFEVPTGKDPIVNFTLKDSVLTTTSHLVFSVTKGEIVFDNSDVNKNNPGKQLENRSTLTIKNGSYVQGAVATSSNAKNPGTLIVDNATYIVTGEFSGSDVGVGKLILRNGAIANVAAISKDKATVELGAGCVLTCKTAGLTITTDSGYEVVYADGKYEAVKIPGLNGSGTEADPFLITSLEDLLLFRDSVNAGETKYNAEGVWVALAADIDLAGQLWTVGIGDGHEWSYDGCFDGKGFAIKNLNIKPYADDYGYVCGGLFGYVNGNVIIRNLVIENATIDGSEIVRVGNPAIEPHNIGVLAGFVYNKYGTAQISGITVKGDIKIDAPNVDGVGVIIGYQGYNGNPVTNCTVDANPGSYIKGYNFVGGIVGYSHSNTTISGCSVKNLEIIGTNYYAGGIAGIALAGNVVSDCTVDTSVSVTGTACVASVVGAVAGEGIVVENCTAQGALVGGKYGTNETVQAKIGNKYYSTLQAAINAAEAGATVTLLTDIALTETLTIAADKDVVLDLAGKILSYASAEAKASAVITNKGKLTVKDSVGGGKITTSALNPDMNATLPHYANNTISNLGELIIESGKIENTTNGVACYAIDNYSGSTLTVNDGEIVSTYSDAIRLFATDAAAATVIINGGTVGSIWAQDSSDGRKDTNYVLTVNGGTIGAIYVEPTYGAEVAIKGGEIEKVVIYDPENGNKHDSLYGIVTGGTFVTAMDEKLIADGFELVENENGTFGIEEKPYVKPSIEVDENNKVGINMPSSIDVFNKVMVFYVGDMEVTGSTSWAELAEEGKKYSAYNGTGGYKIYTNPEMLPTLDTVGNWVVYIYYYHGDEWSAVRKVVTVEGEDTPVQSGEPSIGIDENNKVTITYRETDTFGKVIAFYVGDMELAKNTSWNALVEQGKKFPGVNEAKGFSVYTYDRSMPTLEVAGNWVLYLYYYDADGNYVYVRTSVEVEGESYKETAVTTEGGKLGYTLAEGDTFTKIVAFYAGETEVSATTSWSELTEIGKANGNTKGFTVYNPGDELPELAAGNWVVYLYYTSNGANGTMRVQIKI